MRRLLFIFMGAILVLAAGMYFYTSSVTLPPDVKEAYDVLPKSLDYNVDVKPILSDKCFACHGPDKAKQKAGLRLDIAKFAYAELPEDKGKVAIDPGNLEGSEFFHRILSSDPKYMMPSPESHHTLTATEKAILIKWIKDGAKYKPHWAFVKPVKPDVPEVDHKDWTVNNPIDNFVLAKLEQKKLQPSKQADKELLLRRLSLDLTGLPPTLQEIDNYLKDNSPNAYEKQVDRLLKSPHYGEKMAVDWLDVARYADSHGYTVDRLRDMSPYRDWVIKAFNSNFPYDKFIQWQLAGDLMPHPTRDMIIATAFNRNHPQNMEGGIVEEEFQTEYVIDRTNTFGTAMLGMSVGCAKCHDHKFDPISQKNYYQLYSFFNNVKEAGQISWDDALPTPTLMLPTKQKEKILAFINNNIMQEQHNISLVQSKAAAGFESWLNTGGYKKLAADKVPANGLQAYYTFDKGNLVSNVSGKDAGVMKRESGLPGDKPVFENRDNGKAIVLNGDTWLDLNKVGVFRRSEPFSVGIWVNIPKQLTEGVIFHKSSAERLYNFRGYHLYLKNNKLELNMAHTGPSNAITKVSIDDVPRDQWIQLTATYDGSSKAAGFRLYLNGIEMKMETTMDQLTKDILFVGGGAQPGLQIGGWWRGRGFKDGKADDIAVYNRTLTPFEVKTLAQKASWAAIAAKDQASLSADETNSLKAYYLTAVDPGMLAEEQKLKALRTILADSTENIDELMVMQEMPKPKKSFLLKRGNYDMPGEQVFPNTPEAILPFPKNAPKNRLGLAQWVINPNNPLAARVAVNRIWQNFFGTGIVKTSEDFGNQGEMPSHPELLDWLAVQFVESGWNVKAINKLIVMSATYRQDSRGSKEAVEKDAENRFLSHGPAYRMTAEMIRDNALMASGLLNTQIGGKSVKPYQPEGLWEINNTTYTPDTGKAVYRRSLYVVVKRSVPNPTLATFDAPSRSYCIMRRQPTNTPLQALVTLNDPTFVEASKVMGEQISRSNDSRAAITNTYRKLTGRKPLPKEVDLLLTLQQVELKKFRQHPEKEKGWLNTGQYKVDKKIDGALIAANTVIANAILNSDASLTKR
ncbi:DUF1553 domain-containing protein [Mucilaginibacter sabulilitoris]|uniref:DUF1553 domain-containing protein n=1 Tax=Mucilaginibacter sabulilitoris TaxID=1173583 RepID=A0ABZ0TM83_9SPHI|nr:DUF1553 domain-containing protein [Mucilaginibacter sabulilitoris]WPU92275.1 DUF1553 domain-containing protein [Mucilaginibacter sabulilitoris]